MSDPTNEKPTDGESDVQASNDGTAGVGEDPRGESSFDTQHTQNTEKGGGGR
jgi:hypothetical protein